MCLHGLVPDRQAHANWPLLGKALLLGATSLTGTALLAAAGTGRASEVFRDWQACSGNHTSGYTLSGQQDCSHVVLLTSIYVQSTLMS